jgi:hypothetical protein
LFFKVISCAWLDCTPSHIWISTLFCWGSQLLGKFTPVLFWLLTYTLRCSYFILIKQLKSEFLCLLPRLKH